MSNLNLPDGWKQCSLGELGTFKNGINKSKGDFGYGYPFINLLDIFGKNIIDNPSLNLVNASIKELKMYDLKEKDILFVRSSVKPEGVGSTCVLNNNLPKTVYSGFIIRFRLNEKEHFNKTFLRYCFYAGYFRKSLIRKSSISANTNINQQSLCKLQLLVPPLLEQHAIAETLQTWDTAIEKTEALIEAKERQFGWLQNALLRENSDTWETKPLNSLSQIKKGKQLNRDTLDDSVGFPVWNGGITPSGYTDKSNTAANTITISEGGNSCGFVNLCKEDFWLGGHCYAVEKLDASLDSDFLFFCLKANERRIMRLRVGSGLPNIQKKDIEKLQIQFPPIDEQKKIAETLNTAQQEITLLKKLADQYHTQKRGLMQKLLSGEWHIKNKEAA